MSAINTGINNKKKWQETLLIPHIHKLFDASSSRKMGSESYILLGKWELGAVIY